MFNWFNKHDKKKKDTVVSPLPRIIENENEKFIENDTCMVAKKEIIETGIETEHRIRKYGIKDKNSNLEMVLLVDEFFDKEKKRGKIKANLQTGKEGEEFKDSFEFAHECQLSVTGDDKFSLHKSFLHHLKMKVDNVKKERFSKRNKEEMELDGRRAKILKNVLEFVKDDVCEKSEIAKTLRAQKKKDKWKARQEELRFQAEYTREERLKKEKLNKEKNLRSDVYGNIEQMMLVNKIQKQ